MKTWIELEAMKFYAYHGVFEQERQVGNHFVVSLRVCVDIARSLQSDELDDTISYADLYALVEAEMRQPSRLLEHVAGRIQRRLFAYSERIQSICLRVMKLNPPFSGDVHSASVVLELDRSEAF
ncbi:MAG: dihydroneopterin aldolase [Porphyromonadaceae bacterium]|nr:dihydroneopterin aldolase [Porphyromonadaceae bacterium]